jgi:acyl-coenzyme A synthetase/AMP-(fatty) acid ligase
MFDRHFAHWPPGQPRTLELPRETVYANLAASAARHPSARRSTTTGGGIAYRDLKREVDALAGFLQQRCGVKRGDRVLLYLQNSPQFVIGYYAILRADAVVVPVNPMNLTDELATTSKIHRRTSPSWARTSCRGSSRSAFPPSSSRATPITFRTRPICRCRDS